VRESDLYILKEKKFKKGSADLTKTKGEGIKGGAKNLVSEGGWSRWTKKRRGEENVDHLNTTKTRISKKKYSIW